MRFAYPPMPAVGADLLLVTHEHVDHNGVEHATGDPYVVRSTAGTFDTPVGQVVAIASEHDGAAGTLRGPNAMMVFELEGLRVGHLGDLGQPALREEQAAALGRVDLLFVPAGGGPTIGAAEAAEVVRRLDPGIVVPMHYGTPAVDFLEPVDPFLAQLDLPVVRLEGPEFDARALREDGGPRVVVPAPPLNAGG